MGIYNAKEIIKILNDMSPIEEHIYFSFGAASKMDLHFLTNFSRSQREIYEQAIRDTGIKHLYVAERAVNVLGQVMPDYLRLMTTENKDLSEFWKRVRELKLKTDSHG